MNAVFSNPEILSCGNGRENICRENKTKKKKQHKTSKKRVFFHRFSFFPLAPTQPLPTPRVLVELVGKLPTRWLGEAKTPQMGKFGGSPEKITPTLPGLEGEGEGGEAKKRRFCEENRARSAGLELR